MSVQIKYYNGDNVSDVDYGDCAVFGSAAGGHSHRDCGLVMGG